MLNNIKKRAQSGFTIIEVMIVLAIAGLIMVVVLVAVPQLQRNQRNNASTAVLDRVFTELSNYASNNRGDFPEDSGDLDGFCGRYLSTVDSSGDAINDCDGADDAADFVDDPRTGTHMELSFVSNTNLPTLPTDGSSRPMQVHSNDTSGFTCDGETVDTGNGARSIAVTMPLEGGAVACRDNQ